MLVYHLLGAAVEGILNQVTQLSPELPDKLKATQHKMLTVAVGDFPFTLSLMFDGRRFHVLINHNEPAECAITCDFETLIKLQDPSLVTRLIREGKLDLEGDIGLAQNYSGAFAELNIDWADKLSPYLGDGLSYRLVSHLKALNGATKQKAKQSSNTITALLQDELAVTIHPAQMQIFKQSNRQLHAELDQLEQRINLLSSKLQG